MVTILVRRNDGMVKPRCRCFLWQTAIVSFRRACGRVSQSSAFEVVSSVASITRIRWWTAVISWYGGDGVVGVGDGVMERER